MLLRNDVFARLCHARQLLGKVHEVPVSIKDIATEAQLSPVHFIRQFEALLGVTPHQSGFSSGSIRRGCCWQRATFR